MLIMGVRSYAPRISPPPECREGYSIPCQLIEPACLELLDLAWDITYWGSSHAFTVLNILG